MRFWSCRLNSSQSLDSSCSWSLSHTDRYFTWTIASRLTAAFLGAAHWASLPMVFYGSRESVWTNLRTIFPLSPLVFTTAMKTQIEGVWLPAIAVAATDAIYENDRRRVAGPVASFAAFGILQLIAVARYPAVLAWNVARAIEYVTFLISIVLVELVAALSAKWTRRKPRSSSFREDSHSRLIALPSRWRR